MATALLAQYGMHPNVIGSLTVTLGCETLDAQEGEHDAALAEDGTRGELHSYLRLAH